jgi:hypothetical protein
MEGKDRQTDRQTNKKPVLNVTVLSYHSIIHVHRKEMDRLANGRKGQTDRLTDIQTLDKQMDRKADN